MERFRRQRRWKGKNSEYGEARRLRVYCAACGVWREPTDSECFGGPVRCIKCGGEAKLLACRLRL